MWLQTECRLGKGPAGPFPLPLTPEVWGKAFALPLAPYPAATPQSRCGCFYCNMGSGDLFRGTEFD